MDGKKASGLDRAPVLMRTTEAVALGTIVGLLLVVLLAAISHLAGNWWTHR